MSFDETRFPITQRYLTAGSKRRSGKLISPGVRFIVAHDTGNPNSTANGNVRYYENSRNEMSASAHLFVDDTAIIECIPALTNKPEKAWHVLYGVQTDNNLYGVNANDVAIGVEYCYGNGIVADEAYKRYVWVMALLCYKFSLDPRTSIVGHFFLDPQRKTDPVTGLAHSRRTYEQLLRDIVDEFVDCSGKQLPTLRNASEEAGRARSNVRLNIRKDGPSIKAPVYHTVEPGTDLSWVASVNGDSINGNAKWYKDREGNFFWSGGVG